MPKPILDKPPAETPYDRYRELLRMKGVGEKTALDMVFNEDKWWSGKVYSVKVRDLVYKSELSNHSVLAIAYHVQLHYSDDLIQYRIKPEQFGECVINPWIIMSEIPNYGLDNADKLAAFQKLNHNSPDRIAEVLYDAIEKTMNNRDTYADDTNIKFKFNELTKNRYKNNKDIYNQALEDLQAQKRVVIF